MKAYALVRSGDSNSLTAVNLDKPQPSEKEVLVAIKAAGVTHTELLWYPTTHTSDGGVRIHAVPGHEFSGVVAGVGASVTEFQVGDEVMGMNDWFAQGATAEFCVARVQDIIVKPQSMPHDEAAAMPISALTAWQGLAERAAAKQRERVLIVGAGGSVGLMAVQIAVHLGCRVFAVASSEQTALLQELGCEQVIDYRTQRFEDRVRDIDVVFDAVGGDSLIRAEAVMAAGGRMVTIAADAEGNNEPAIKQAFFIVEPSAEQLTHLVEMHESGKLRLFVKGRFRLDDAPRLYGNEVRVSGPGKFVIEMRAAEEAL